MTTVTGQRLLSKDVILKLMLLLFTGSRIVNALMVNPLPKPRNITWGPMSPIIVEEQMKLISNQKDQIIEEAFMKTFDTIRKVKWVPAATENGYTFHESSELIQTYISHTNSSRINQINVTINNYDLTLQLGVNETYSLKVESQLPSIIIESETVWGALRAFSTLQQLIIFDEKDKIFLIESSVTIWDAPIYQHRGLMIDSGRNFLPVEAILEQIDIMWLCKMNSLHWHFEDSQSWPLEIFSYPEMTLDAYSDKETYTQKEVRYIIQYALERGIRVIPELDLPGHARAGWTRIDKELISCGDEPWNSDIAVEPPPGQLDIAYQKTYNVVECVYNEISSLFQDNIFHIGGDEINELCYNKSRHIRDWYNKNPGSTINDVMQYWVDKILPIFIDRDKRRLTAWEDLVTSENAAKSLPKDVILQCWSGGVHTIKDLTHAGYDVIVSSASHFYLDCGYGGFVTNDHRYTDSKENQDFNQGNGGSWCNPYKTWQRIYAFDFAANLSQDEMQHIIGAEVTLWSEQVDTTVLTQKIWPRAAALAELTWSGNKNIETGKLRTNLLTQRLFNFREYLVALGYKASPLVPRFCIKNPHACDLYTD